MKQLKTILASASILLLCACSQDLPNGPAEEPNDFGNGFYSKISFRFPGSTRAGEADASDSGTTTPTDPTGKQGEEVGQAYENKIGSILVVMANKVTENGKDVYKFISFALNDAPLTEAATNKYTITFQDKDELYNHAEQTVYLFAYCNPTPELRQKVAGKYDPNTGKYTGGLEAGATFTDEICSANVESTWTHNGFLMTSSKIVSKELPKKDVLKTYNSSSNAFNLGTIEVMRTMSRFDFRDAARDKDSTNEPLTYAVMNQETKKPQGKVKFTRVALFNVSDRFYYLPHTKTTDNDNILCPEDIELGEVLSPKDRSYTMSLPTRIDPIVTNPNADLVWESLDEIIAGTEDEEEGSDPWKDKGYRIWTYATENTFLNEDFNPAEEGAKFDPTNKLTGYVFEAEIIVDGKTDDKPMYLFGGTLYKSAKDIYDAIQNLPVSTLSSAFEAAFTTTGSGEFLTINPKDDDAVKNAGFTAYKANAEGKFLCYYFAYNKHNDDGDPTKTEAMEFGTVRNNVYKLAITDVKKFGTFEPSPNVEDWDIFFQLSVQVRKWTVRMNNLEF